MGEDIFINWKGMFLFIIVFESSFISKKPSFEFKVTNSFISIKSSPCLITNPSSFKLVRPTLSYLLVGSWVVKLHPVPHDPASSKSFVQRIFGAAYTTGNKDWMLNS